MTDSSLISQERERVGEGRGRGKGLGLFAVLQTYACPLLSSLPFLPPCFPPSPSILKKSFPFMLCARTRWEKLQALCSRLPWQLQGIPVRGDRWHSKVSQAPWGRGGERKRGGRGAGASSHVEQRAASRMKGAHTSPVGQWEFCWLAVKGHTEDTMVCDTWKLWSELYCFSIKDPSRVPFSS